MSSGITRTMAALSVAAGLAACASSNGGPPSTSQQAAAGNIPASQLQWFGKFKQGEAQSSEAGMHGRHTSVGDVRLTADSRNVTRAQITFSVDVSPALSGAFRWDMAPGECGTNSFPLIPVNQFPLLPLSNNRGSLDASVNFPLPTSGRYHVDVFQTSGADIGDAIGCADMTLGRKGRDR